MDEDEANIAQEEPPDELGQALLDALKDSESEGGIKVREDVGGSQKAVVP